MDTETVTELRQIARRISYQAHNMPQDQLWDLEVALASVDRYEEDLRDLIRIWLRQTPELLTVIRAGVAGGDTAGVHLAAHTLKGSMDILGADEVSAVAAKLEVIEPAALATHGDQFAKQLETLVAKLTPQVTAYLNMNSS